MKTNMLDYMYEGYGYDMDNQLLYTSTENYDKALDKDGYSDNGMKTFSSKDIELVSHKESIDVANANEYKIEVGQFISEEGSNYTDLRQAICGCNPNGSPKEVIPSNNEESGNTPSDDETNEESGTTSGGTANDESTDAESGVTTNDDSQTGDTNSNESGETESNEESTNTGD